MNQVNPEEKMMHEIDGKEVPSGDKSNDDIRFQNATNDNNVAAINVKGLKAESENNEFEIAEAKKKREREPLQVCKWMAERTNMFFGITLGCQISFLVLTVILVIRGYDIVPFKLDKLPLDLIDDPDFLRAKAWNQRGTLMERTLESDADAVVPNRTESGEVVELFYEVRGGNVFTKANLQRIKDAEDSFYQNEKFVEGFCKLDISSGECAKSYSVLRFFDGTYSALDPIFNDPNFDDIVNVLDKADALATTKTMLQIFLGKTAIIDATDNIARSEITRSYMYLGIPLPGYDNSTDREESQKEKIKSFMKLTLGPILERVSKSGLGPIDFIYGSSTLLGLGIGSQAMADMMLVMASLGFIFIFMLIQTRSLMVTGLGIFSIMTNFCMANLIYRIVFDFIYLSSFHILSMFIILGIGADDIFVFYDTWRISCQYEYLSLAHRLSDVYRKASVAMLFTSLTTAAAFFIGASSPLLAVNSFGLFSGILVTVNYISVVLFFPCVVVKYHKTWKDWSWWCCRSCVTPAGSTTTDVHESVNLEGANDSNEEIASNDKRENAIGENVVVKFMSGPYFKFITHRVVKWLVLAFFIIQFSTFVYFNTLLEINEEQIKFLKDTSNFGKLFDRRANAFMPSNQDPNMKVYIAWGLKNQDMSGCHKTDTACEGVTVYDNTFNLNDAGTQQALKSFCAKLKSLSQVDVDRLRIRRNIITNDLEVQCFIDDMETFLKADESATVTIPPAPAANKYSSPVNLSLPWVKSNVEDIMNGLWTNNFYNTSSLPLTYNNYFEIALDYWLYNGLDFSDPLLLSENQIKYGSLLGVREIPGVTQQETMTAGANTIYGPKYGTRLQYAAIIVNTTLVTTKLGYPTGLPVRDAWESFVTREIKKMPVPLKGGFQCTPIGTGWHWLKVQRSLDYSATTGIIIGLCIAFPILVIATKNIIVGFFATCTITLITSGVCGMMPIAGWKLGVLESLNLVLVVGLSVDYVVHMAEGYSRSPKRDRLGRVHSMLEEVGVSVISGSITTLGASVFMFFAEILFFTQFGIFIFSTIGFSLIYALGFFTVGLVLLGPQNDFGSIMPIARRLKLKFSQLFGDCRK
ncbi:unnamed protein product [Owenia fusiformis]|uniref:Uncharacterized protein n=1 Tax=Owenia fusiformis TaxID=6347 RepID=A0A8J1TGT5_OWEFU|nr:unnamed protein product [Owenia fusiformis]